MAGLLEVPNKFLMVVVGGGGGLLHFKVYISPLLKGFKVLAKD